MGLSIPADRGVKLKESEKRYEYLDLARELQKSMEHECDGYINCNWYTRYNHQMIGKGTRRLGNKRRSGDHPDDSIIKIGLNPEKSPGDLRRLAVTQTPVSNHQLTLCVCGGWIFKRVKLCKLFISKQKLKIRRRIAKIVIGWKS